ncbi:MAG: tRNA 2-selenouridine(34) synthase MnmH [Ignavibacteria bacterium]|nr:tRNA 2-selenouridine(34) synthase MnmH [Ignavibacteria bacterium]
MAKDSKSKELFDYIRTINTDNLPDLKTIFSNYNWNRLNADEVLSELKMNSDEILLIDARSENEFNESALPFAINFPVLNNSERHNVGLVYKKYSHKSALWLAMSYADPKNNRLKNFLEENNASQKILFVYCWRGGGRSSYLSKMISDLGHNPSVLFGGYKSYRELTRNYFKQNNSGFNLIELSGLTGCGKSELLQNVSNELPVIDLEFAARHFSSLLGHIPYQIQNFPPVSNQTAFENNIFSQIYFNSKKVSADKPETFIIESESRRIGPLEMPEIIYTKLKEAKSVKIICSLENRIKRIIRDYFGDDLRGIEPMIITLTDKQKFFRQQLSNEVFNNLISLLENKKVYEFSEIMIVDYYDKKYIDKGKIPVAEISTDNIEIAKQELIQIYRNDV